MEKIFSKVRIIVSGILRRSDIISFKSPYLNKLFKKTLARYKNRSDS